MRIAIVTNNFPTASETFISNKVLCFAAEGHQVIVFCSSFNMAAWTKLNSGNYNVAIELTTRKILIQYFILHPALWFSSLVIGGDRAKKVLIKFFTGRVNKRAPDVIHFEFSGIGIHYMDAFKNIVGKKIVSCRGSAEKVKLLVLEERKEKIKELFSEVNAIHCVSDDMRQTILPYCSNPSKIFINRPSIDETIFKRTLRYPSGGTIKILSVGRFTFQKGYLTGLLAIKKLKELFQNFVWIIVGDGTQKEEIIFHIHQMGLQKHVLLVGTKSRAEILDLYNTVAIFFLPSVYEGIANVALEAMSMQLPVVATKSGGMEEVITHNHDGLLADVYDSDALAGHLLALINNAEQRETLGLHARERIVQNFTITKQVDIFKTEYKKLLTN